MGEASQCLEVINQCYKEVGQTYKNSGMQQDSDSGPQYGQYSRITAMAREEVQLTNTGNNPEVPLPP